MTITSAAPARTGDLDAVREAIRRHIATAADSTPAAAVLWREIGRIALGGKMVRPGLLQLAHRGLGGRPSASEARVAAGFELLHTGFLIHDDVIDRDWVRRGEPNLAAVFRARALERGRRREVADRAGASAAIIAGDLAIAAAVDLISTGPDSGPQREALADIAQSAVGATAAGELMDVELASAGGADADIDVGTVLAMYEAKTGVYSFSAPLEAGAVLAGAEPGVRDALRRAGLAIGVAYQIVDDLLGIFGDPSRTGKSVVSDAREEKTTVLAAMLAEQTEQERLVSEDEPATPEEAAARLRDLYERNGIRVRAVDLARAKSQEAVQHLLALPAALQGDLSAVIDDLGTRLA
ncbi:polyprenyl synthetase family protein [Amnibacterium sp.]|uniref:polyprenyl synthetase family protein n=1 Tax=Amnibacterium sp. TaxID=1872496 RepID=UPI003F7C6D09